MTGRDAVRSTTTVVAKWRTDQVRDEMQRRYLRQGQSLRRIARAMGCAYGTVHGVLTTAGVRLRPKGGGYRRKRRTP
ncbi:helix-turn-helix domain-containing protein [Dactylosporangium sp. NPDC005555]|uniref:helix-turn-helix domain-containing protein n=1 Tax=Dactylosporangium sp. NPDC005555 TaxID=3154889 RepID=UPI0033BB2A9E